LLPFQLFVSVIQDKVVSPSVLVPVRRGSEKKLACQEDGDSEGQGCSRSNVGSSENMTGGWRGTLHPWKIDEFAWCVFIVCCAMGQHCVCRPYLSV
jgi:hypothetical protein